MLYPKCGFEIRFPYARLYAGVSFCVAHCIAEFNRAIAKVKPSADQTL